MPSPTIAFDAMGGDFAPTEIVRGVARLSLESNLDILLVGDGPKISALLAETRHNAERIAVHHTAQAVGGDEPALDALSKKPFASLLEAARLVADGKADALVTAGNIGALTLACSETLSLLPGVRQAALATVFPTELRRGAKADPFSLILDVGANLEASAADLCTYALMGATYAQVISRNPVPRVALLSSGAEDEREHPTILQAHRTLLSRQDIEYVGRIEGRQIPAGEADVVVTSGLLGGVASRLLAGVAETVLELARYAYHERLAWRLGLTMLSGGLRRLKRLTDWQEYGGAPLLGFDRVVIQADRRSGAQAILNAGKVAAKAVHADVPGAIAERLAPERLLAMRG
jgi:glycerol-3-phosphate acyltransferase PlsX